MSTSIFFTVTHWLLLEAPAGHSVTVTDGWLTLPIEGSTTIGTELLASTGGDGDGGVGVTGQLAEAGQLMPLFVVPVPEPPPPHAERTTLTLSSAMPRVWLKVFILMVFREGCGALLQVVCAEIGGHEAREGGRAEEMSWAARRFDLKLAVALD